MKYKDAVSTNQLLVKRKSPEDDEAKNLRIIPTLLLLVDMTYDAT
jgi:hypothetical protein